MRLKHGLAFLVCAAIVMIAAQFVAGPALAHSGHLHTHSAPFYSAAAQAAHQDYPAPIAGAASAGESHLTASPSERGELPPAQASGCAGGCCSHGVGCCGAAIAASAFPLPDFGTQDQRPSAPVGYGAGADPDTLTRPPRTLA
ncbi:MAG: hypothetical protein WBA66_03505 [Xanthobacteraceae bacterium]